VRITKVETFLLDLPLPHPQKRAFGIFDRENHAIIRLTTDEGLEGLGEAAACGGPNWSEDCAESVKVVVDRFLAPLLLDEDPLRVEHLLRKMDAAVKGNRFAKAAIESALLDVLAKSLNAPLYTLLGGLYRDRLPITWLLNTDDVPAAIEEAEEWLARGVRIFKLKVGAADPNQEITAVLEIAEALKGRAAVRVDANGGWNIVTALRVIPHWEGVVEYVEQPLPREDVEGMARLVRSCPVPIAADESLFTVGDALRLVKERAADVFLLKLGKAGGILACKRQAAIAEAAGIPCVISTMIDSSIATSAALHFGLSTPIVTHGSELLGPLFLMDDLVEESVRYEGGNLLAPAKPGLGVSLDEEKVERYRRSL
jgi:muconate cycloisomerase